MSESRRNRWTPAARLGLALAAALALPLAAQEGAAPWEGAIARLDFPAALDALAAALAADPADPAPRLARADLHLRMQRPALALADLDAVLAADPAHVPALMARAGIWDSQRAWNRARADLDAAIAAAPGDPAPRAARARVNEHAGLTDAARDDYSAASALAPDDPDLRAAVARLAAAQGADRAAGIVFSEAAVMAEAFLVTEGAATAPDTLHVVHAAPDLAADYAGIDRAALGRAVDSGALRVVHLFTYTGADASIWGNLALICAGSDGFAATHAALASAAGQSALGAVETGDFAPLETLLAEAYGTAGLDPTLVETCARDRRLATRYLADWQDHRDAETWRGVNLLEHWPVWVWNGAPLGPAALNEALAGIAPPPQAPEALPPEPAAPGGAAARADDGAAQERPPAPDPDGTETAAAPAADPVPPPADMPPAATGSLFPTRPEPAGDVRVPVPLRGIYAPDLAACLGYLDRIESPARIDAVLPGMNPLDGPVLGTILVTSRRVYLFNAVDTECAIAGAGARAAAADGWSGAFSCASPLAPDAGTALELAPAEPDGSAPRITARYATGAPTVLRQCRALGQLGRAFAPLWTRDTGACTASVPVAPGRFTFSVDPAGTLVLRVAPAAIPAEAGRSTLHAVVDGAPLSESPGRWDGTGWQMPLGAFDSASEQLGWGMFLDTRASGADFEARLPLFGSGAAMSALSDCAPDAR